VSNAAYVNSAQSSFLSLTICVCNNNKNNVSELQWWHLVEAACVELPQEKGVAKMASAGMHAKVII